MRNKCTTCHKPGKQIDDRVFECSKHGAWDGSADFVERINYEKNRYSVPRNLIGNDK